MNNNISINGETPVFGLDIGTRSVVGTVGYRQGDRFVVIAQEIREHQTRAMLDGQIHANKTGCIPQLVSKIAGRFNLFV